MGGQNTSLAAIARQAIADTSDTGTPQDENSAIARSYLWTAKNALGPGKSNQEYIDNALGTLNRLAGREQYSILRERRPQITALIKQLGSGQAAPAQSPAAKVPSATAEPTHSSPTPGGIAGAARAFIEEDAANRAAQEAQKVGRFQEQTTRGTKAQVPQVIKPSLIGSAYSGAQKASQAIFGEQPTPETTAARGTAKPAGSPTYVYGPKPDGLLEPGNLNLDGRPIVHNSDGTISSEYSISFGTDKGEVLVPTVVNGRFLTPDGRKPKPGSQAEREMFKAAEQHYYKTGENLGVFDTPEHADSYAQKVHNRKLIASDVEPVKSEAEIQRESPFKMQPMPKPETISEQASRVGETLVKLEPPDHPSPNQAYWEHEYAARTRDLQKIADVTAEQQKEQQQAAAQQANIEKMPLDMRIGLSFSRPGTLLGNLINPPKQPPKIDFESDYFKHRQAEAEQAGKSIWDVFPTSVGEALTMAVGQYSRPGGKKQTPQQLKAQGAHLALPLVSGRTIAGNVPPVLQEAANALAGVTSPDNIALAGTLGELEAATSGSTGFLRQSPRIVSGLFATQVGANLVEAAKQYKMAMDAGDKDGAKRILGSAAVQVPLLLLTAYHTVMPRPPWIGTLAPKDLVERVNSSVQMSRDTVDRLKQAGFTNQQISLMSIDDIQKALEGQKAPTTAEAAAEKAPEGAPAAAAAAKQTPEGIETSQAVKPPRRVPVSRKPPSEPVVPPSRVQEQAQAGPESRAVPTAPAPESPAPATTQVSAPAPKTLAETAREAIGGKPEPKTQALEPSKALTSAEESGRPEAVAAGSPPATQEPSRKVSIATLPSEPTTARTTSPSETTGPAITEPTSIVPSTRRILQQHNDVEKLQEVAAAKAPEFRASLEKIASEVPGVTIDVRPNKNLARLQEKIRTTNRQPSQVSDYLAGRIEVENMDQYRKVLDKVRALHPVVEDDNFLAKGKASKGGYRAHNLQIDVGDGLTAELQIVPKDVAATSKKSHALYERMRSPGITPEEYKAAQQEAIALNNKAWEAFAARQPEAKKPIIPVRVPVGRGIKGKLTAVDQELLNRAKEKASTEKNEHMQTVLSGMKIGNISPADRNLLNDYLGLPEGTSFEFQKPKQRVPIRRKPLTPATPETTIQANAGPPQAESLKPGREPRPEQPRPGQPLAEPARASEGVLETKPAENVQGTEPERPAASGEAGGGTNRPAGESGIQPVRSERDRLSESVSGAGERVESVERRRGRSPQLAPSTKPAGNDYHITAEDNLGEGGVVSKYIDNLAAITLLKKIEGENRKATPEEQKTLVKYVGWGGIPQAFDPYNREWSKRYEELKKGLTEEEWDEARGSTQFAHYTSEDVIRFMYDALKKMGYDSGRMIEPAAGIGHFLGLMPLDMAAESKRMAVEIDSVSGRIAGQLYQNAETRVSPFEKVKLPRNFFDLVATNVPFSDVKPFDPDYDKLKLNLHNYFLVRGLDILKPGGLMAVITSRYTLDGSDADAVRARKLMADRADLVTAFRLPATAFKQNANTEVVTDMLFFQKRAEGQESHGEPFENVSRITIPESGNFEVDKSGYSRYRLNDYYLRNPENIIGKLNKEGSLYGGQEMSVSLPASDIADRLKEALDKVPTGQYAKPQPARTTADQFEQAVAERKENVKPFGFLAKEDKIFQYDQVGEERTPSGETVPRFELVEQKDLSGNQVKLIRRALEVRDLTRNIFAAELAGKGPAELAGIRGKLNASYDKFEKKFGPLNGYTAARLLHEDPDYPLLQALENYDPEKKQATKTDIFFKRTVSGKVTPQVKVARDAMLHSLSEYGKLDWDQMGSLLGKSGEEVRAELLEEGSIFRNPEGNWETADDYLSGNVRKKYAAAEAAAKIDPQFKRNADALKDLVPKDLTPGEIHVRLGSAWVPSDVVKQFMDETLGFSGRKEQVTVTYSPNPSRWIVKVGWGADNAVNSQTWGTQDFYGSQLVELALNLKEPVAYDRSGDKSVVNIDRTLQAQEKQKKLMDRFSDWVWEDSNRAERLGRLYNDAYNSTIPWKADGQHLTVPSLAAGLNIHPWVKDGIWRILRQNSAYIAYEVGLGKTLVYLGGALEAKRIGRFRKPMIVAHNATVEGYRKDAQRFFPGQKVLIVTNEDLSAGNRQRFMSRIATGDWDAVVVPHSSFGLLPARPETYERFMLSEVRATRQWLETEKADMDRRTVKQIEKAVDRIENRIMRKIETLRKKQDTTVFFEDLGVDALFVDEADQFKNLMFNTQMTRVAGLGNPEGSDRALDLLMKSRFIKERNNGPGVYFASGTPVSNTIAEVYGIQKYLMPKELEESGLGQFDAWAAQFGTVISQLESSPEDPTKFRIVKSFADFNNLPDLARMWTSVADYRTAESVGLKLPKVNTDYRVVKPTPEQKNYVAVELSARAQAIRNRRVDPSEDNMLNVTTDGRKAALDMRLIDPNASDVPGSKINELVDDIYKEWKNSREKKGVQLVALDLSTPADKTKGKFMAYRDIRDKLVRRGIPKEEIAWIHDYNTPDKFRKFQNQANDGTLAIVMGSTNKMGVGINIQKKAIGIQNVDIGWRPRDIEQRRGRVQRQGNENDEVFERFWTTKETFDAYMLQKNETKQKFIHRFLRGEITQRKGVEDISARALTFAEIKAITTGRPEAMEKIQVDAKLDQLQRLASQHEVEQRNLRVQAGRKKAAIDEYDLDVAAVKDDIATAQKSKTEEFSVRLGKKQLTERKEAGAELITLLGQSDTARRETLEKVGKYAGFDIYVVGAPETAARAFLRGRMDYSISRSEDPVGIMRSMEGRVEALPDRLAGLELRRTQEQTNLKEIEGQIGKPFDKQEEMNRLVQRSQELSKILELSKDDEQAQAAEPPAEEQPEAPEGTAFGEQNRVFTKERAEAARKRFREKAGALHAGLDPTMLKDLIEIGGYYLEAGIRDFAEWSRKMLQQFGETGLVDKIEPELRTIYDSAVSRGEESRPGFAANIRLENLKTAAEVIEVIKQTARQNAQKIREQRRGEVPFQKTKDAARKLVEDGQLSEADLSRMKKGTALNAEELKAARSILVNLSEDVAKKLAAFREDDSRSNLLDVMAAVKKQRAVQAAVSGAVAEAGRALNSMKIAAEGIRAKTAKERVLEALGGDISEEMIRRLAQIPDNDHVALNRFIRDHTTFTTLDKLNAYWMANILSSWWTPTRIGTSSALWTMANLAARPIAGLADAPLSRIFEQERKYTPGETIPALVGLFEGIPEAVRKVVYIMQHGIDPDSAQYLETPRFYQFPGGPKNPFNWPGRAVAASHWFWRSINTQSEMSAIAARKALRRGTKGAYDRFKQYRNELTPEDVQQAKNFGRYVGFADPPGQLTGMMIRLRNWKVPEDWFAVGGLQPLRYIVPFINIAQNIAKASFELSPAGLSKLLSGKTRKTPGAPAEVIAKALIGSAVLAAIAVYVATNEITAEYPKTAGEQDEWKRLGKRPYSIKINGKWYPYLHWSGPFGIGMSAVASAKQAHEARGDMPTSEQATEVATAVGRAMVDQSFFRGLANFMDAMREGGSSATRFASDIASGMVPFSSAMRSAASEIDPYQREARGIGQQIARGIPFLSKKLPPQRTALGQPVPSGLISEASKDPVSKEMARLGIRPGPLSDKLLVSKVEFDLSPKGRDYYRKMTGQTLYQVLYDLIQSPAYQASNDFEKQDQIQRQVQVVRQAGRNVMLSRLASTPEFRAEQPFKIRIPFARKTEAAPAQKP